MTEKKKMSPALKGILVLVVIAVVCVAILAVLNDILYVPPDMTNFNKAAEGVYDNVKNVEKVDLASGKVLTVCEGKLTDGTKVVGLYVQGKKYLKADSFELTIVIALDSNKIVGAYEVIDGSTGGYKYNEAQLAKMVGKLITNSTIFNGDTDTLITGVTNSSNAVLNCFKTAAEYYSAVYLK